jgi:nucleoside phosphorylase
LGHRVTPDVLILAAFDPELAPFRSALGNDFAATIVGRRVTARVAGIGLPSAAVGAATHIAELRPRAVVLVGTCGAYATSGLAIGDSVVARRLRLVGISSLSGQTEFPESMPIVTEAHVPMSEALAAAGARPCCVATTLAITVDDDLAARIAQGTRAHVEHLEAHGVAMACAARGVPFAAALGVANFVGRRGRGEWRTHHGIAETAAAALVLRWLELGAMGLIP